jgi:hypothetical protein
MSLVGGRDRCLRRRCKVLRHGLVCLKSIHFGHPYHGARLEPLLF